MDGIKRNQKHGKIERKRESEYIQNKNQTGHEIKYRDRESNSDKIEDNLIRIELNNLIYFYL